VTGDASAALASLDKEIEGCRRCDLFLTATRAVPGEGPADADIMLVGEAPGFNEDKQGRPFVGAAGKFLEELLGVAGLTRRQVFITNVVKHRPPNNRDPAPGELMACRPWLDQQLEIINPRLVVTLGRFSLGTFFPGSMISKVHGQLREKDGRHFFAMYHPAAALHQQALRNTLLSDMERLAAYLNSPEWRDGGKTVQAGNDDEPPEQLSLF